MITRFRRVARAILLAEAALLLFSPGRTAVADDLREKTKEPDFARLEIPRYPGMTFVGGTVEKQAQTTVGAEGTTGVQGPGAGLDIYLYSTPDTIEQVVDFYVKRLGQEVHWSELKNLKEKFPSKRIPERSKGRQATFVVRAPKSADGPLDPATAILGKAHILISDFFKDPQKDELLPKTTIMFIELKPGASADVGPPPPVPAPWPPELPEKVEPPSPRMP